MCSHHTESVLHGLKTQIQFKNSQIHHCHSYRGRDKRPFQYSLIFRNDESRARKKQKAKKKEAKGAELTHTNIGDNISQFSNPEFLMYGPSSKAEEQERVTGVLPLYHLLEFSLILTTGLSHGCHLICLPKFVPKDFVHIFAKHKVTVAILVPPLIHMMVHSEDFKREHFERLHTAVVSAAPMCPHIIQKILDKVGHYIFFQHGYGMTETLATYGMPKEAKNTKAGSAGKLFPSTQAKIVDLITGEILGPRQNGELCVRGPQIMKEYFENETATRNTIDTEGWFHTGDIGYHNEEDYLYLVDRLKDLIKVKGLQVSPTELENVLMTLEGVVDSAVIEVPTKSNDELPRAYIVRRNEDLTPPIIHAFMKSRLAKHKQLLGGIQFIQDLPKSNTGKMNKKQLKEDYITNKDRRDN